jgi:hypothetical protein
MPATESPRHKSVRSTTLERMRLTRQVHLEVRITGYSAVFVDMAPGAQDEIIRREEMSRA